MLQSFASVVTGNPWFIAAMLAAIGAAIWERGARIGATTAILVVNWLLALTVTLATFDPAHPWEPRPWIWYASIDYLAAFFLIVLVNPKPPQALIGLIYAMMIILHVAYWKAGATEWATFQYDKHLTWAATAQFLVVTGWGLHGIYRRRRGAVRGAPTNPTGAASCYRKGA